MQHDANMLISNNLNNIFMDKTRFSQKGLLNMGNLEVVGGSSGNVKEQIKCCKFKSSVFLKTARIYLLATIILGI